MSQKMVEPAVRYPRRENASEHAVYFDGLPDLCRHEEAMKTDVNRIVAQFGGDLRSFAVAPSSEAVVDYTIDLADAIRQVDDLNARWFALPQAVRDKYRSWDAVAEAGRRGELVEVDGRIDFKPVPASAGSSGDGGAGSASVSAAGGDANAS